MNRIISVHEYKLKSSISGEQFELAIRNAQEHGLFNLPGLLGYHFLKRIRGTRQTDYTSVWIYQDKDSWVKLWGEPDNPVEQENYPKKWKIWENEILAPLLTQDPDRIYYASYEEFYCKPPRSY